MKFRCLVSGGFVCPRAPNHSFISLMVSTSSKKILDRSGLTKISLESCQQVMRIKFHLLIDVPLNFPVWLACMLLLSFSTFWKKHWVLFGVWDLRVLVHSSVSVIALVDWELFRFRSTLTSTVISSVTNRGLLFLWGLVMIVNTLLKFIELKKIAVETQDTA